MTFIVPGCILAISALVLSADPIAAISPAAESGAAIEIVATYDGGQVTAEQYASWNRFRGDDEEPVEQQAEIEAMLLVTELSRQAREAGLADTSEANRAFEALVIQMLKPVLQRHRAAAIQITDEAVDAALTEHPDAFQKPARVRLRTLFKRLPPGADEATRAAVHRTVEELRTQILAGADFAALATTESDSQARFRGGILGNVEPGDLPPQIESIAFALEPGEVSEIVSTSDGLSLLYCEKRLPPIVSSPEEVRELVSEQLLRFEIKQDWERYLAELLERAAPRFPDRQPVRPEDVVAHYESGTVSLADVETWRSAMRAPLGGDPPLAALQSTARNIIQGRMLATEARRLGLDDSPELAERLDWKKSVWLATGELSRRVGSRIAAPSEAAVRQYFEAHRDQFLQRERFDLSVILMLAAEGDLPQRYRQAIDLRESLVSGELDFAAAAGAHSEHPTSADGGRIRHLERRAMAGLGSNVFKSVTQLKPGEISQVVQQDLALWIVRLDGREPQRMLEFEEARDMAQSKLGNEIVSQEQERLEAEIRQALAVELVR